jgi:ubiquinone/menaquinone biosynthesis C-methylase UbiE
VTGLSFDRAADYYDATRGLPAETVAEIVDVLARELQRRRLSLEIGVGTGRIALPLHESGVRLIGADVSAPMLERLVANAGGRLPFPLVRADGTDLPLLDRSVDAVLASHVLHLIPEWTAVVDEALRVIRPGGELLVDFGGGPGAPWSEGTNAIFQRHGIDRVRPGVSDPRQVEAYLAGRATLRAARPISRIVRRSLASDLYDWEHQVHSWTWLYRPDQMADASRDIRRWADTEGHDVNAEVELTSVIQWWVYDVSG